MMFFIEYHYLWIRKIKTNALLNLVNKGDIYIIFHKVIQISENYQLQVNITNLSYIRIVTIYILSCKLLNIECCRELL